MREPAGLDVRVQVRARDVSPEFQHQVMKRPKEPKVRGWGPPVFLVAPSSHEPLFSRTL